MQIIIVLGQGLSTVRLMRVIITLTTCTYNAKTRIFHLKTQKIHGQLRYKDIFIKCSALSLSCSFLLGCNSLANLDSDPNIQKQLTIKRDSFGTPHIYADDTYGLFYGYGYAIATDRLFQMEMSKRTGWGNVAEVLGS